MWCRKETFGKLTLEMTVRDLTKKTFLIRSRTGMLLSSSDRAFVSLQYNESLHRDGSSSSFSVWVMSSNSGSFGPASGSSNTSSLQTCFIIFRRDVRKVSLSSGWWRINSSIPAPVSDAQCALVITLQCSRLSKTRKNPSKLYWEKSSLPWALIQIASNTFGIVAMSSWVGGTRLATIFRKAWGSPASWRAE